MTSTNEGWAGPPAWRVAAGLAVVVILAVALVVVMGADDADPVAAAPDLAVMPTTAATTLAAPSTPAPASSVAPASAARDPRSDLTAAFEAWGLFAVTGDLEGIAATFSPEGPQYAQLESEAAGIGESALGPPAFDFVMTDPVIVTRTPDAVTLRGDVTVSRPGVETTMTRWDVELRWDPDATRWRLWTVTSVGEE